MRKISVTSSLRPRPLTPARVARARPAPQGLLPEEGWRLLVGNHLKAPEKMARGHAGFSVKTVFGGRHNATVYVGRTDIGRGLFLDQERVAGGTVVATADGWVADEAAEPEGHFSIRIPGGRFFVLGEPTVEHPGNLINSILNVPGEKKTKKRETANVTFKYDSDLNLVVFTTTREVFGGTEFKADYSGDKRLRLQMLREVRESKKERARRLAVEGRTSRGRFTSASTTAHSCPICRNVFSATYPAKRLRGHILACMRHGPRR